MKTHDNIAEKKEGTANAVSPVIGELLILATTVILLGVFAATLNAYLPDTRPISVNVRMTVTDNTDGTNYIIFYHKGGDPVPDGDMRVIMFYPNGSQVDLSLNGLDKGDDKDGFFNLSSNRTVRYNPSMQGATVRLIAGNRHVIFSGVVHQ